jgi:hypothetical protein
VLEAAAPQPDCDRDLSDPAGQLAGFLLCRAFESGGGGLPERTHRHRYRRVGGIAPVRIAENGWRSLVLLWPNRMRSEH